MRTILKRAAYLQPGDVLAPIGGYPRRVFRYFSVPFQMTLPPGRTVQLITADLDEPAPAAPGQFAALTPPRAPECWDADKPLQVEVADDVLEPRELDLLAEVARMQLNIGLDPARQAAVVEILNRVRPEAPGVEELLELAERTLQALTGNDPAPCVVTLRGDLEAMLERARRTGVLPRG